MPDRVHAEFTEDERMLAGEILQAQQVAFEIALVVKINVEARKIGILRSRYSVGGYVAYEKSVSGSIARPICISSSTNSITLLVPSQRAIVLEISFPTR